MQADVLSYLPIYRTVPGWFAFHDLLIFDVLLDLQTHEGIAGDLLEIGVMHGKSAFFLSRKRQASEKMVVCDLFDLPAPCQANARENSISYPGVSIAGFRRRAHELGGGPMEVHQRPSETLLEVLAHRLGSFRFVHIDGGHLFEQVRGDMAVAEALVIAEGGWVVFDDYRTAHAPGVAAAVWPAISAGRLYPVVLSETKMYATTTPISEVAFQKLSGRLETHFDVDKQELFGRAVLRTVAPLDESPYRRPVRWCGRRVTGTRLGLAMARIRGAIRR